MAKLDDYERYPLLFGPSPVHPLKRLSKFLGGDVSIWAKREDCNSGIAFGGNKVRKLEYFIPDAMNKGCDTLVSIGGIQSNHTRQVTGVAAHIGMKAVTVQEAWGSNGQIWSTTKSGIFNYPGSWGAMYDLIQLDSTLVFATVCNAL